MSVEYYSVGAMAKLLKVRRSILVRLIRAEKLPAIDLGVEGKVNLRITLGDVASALRYTPKKTSRTRKTSRANIKMVI